MGGRRITDTEARDIALFIGNYVASSDHPFPGMGVKWPVTCFDCGEERQITLHNVISHGSRCKVCDARRRANATRTPVEDVTAILDALGCDGPIGPYLGKLYLTTFRHRLCGEFISDITINKLEHGTWACPHCKEFDRILHFQREIGDAGWSLMSTPVKGSHNVLAEHSCGFVHSFDPWALNRTTGTLCPACGLGGGYRSTLPGYFYLLRFVDVGAIKIGISNHPSQRVKQHSMLHEVETLLMLGPADGQRVRDAEQKIIQSWREAGIPCALDGPGRTESAAETLVNVSSLTKVMTLLVQ